MPENSLTAELATEIKKLWHAPQPKIIGIRQIARKILVEATDAVTVDEFFSFEPASNDETSLTLANSLYAARFAAWASASFVKLTTDAETTVCATLLTDMALIAKSASSKQQVEQRHASLSAAMIGRTVDAPAAMSIRVARHHERSDGSGFPKQLTGDQLTRADRLIGLAVRFSELFHGDVTDTMQRLHAEARRGLFDSELSANLVLSMTGSPPAAISFNHQIASGWAFTDFGLRKIRIDSAHRIASRPHFSFQRSLTAPSVAEQRLH